MRILVSVDALTALGSRLRAARDALSGDPRSSVGGIGFPDLVAAVGEFDGSWSERRRELGASLDDAHGLLTDVVTDFTAADTGLAGSLGARPGV